MLMESLDWMCNMRQEASVESASRSLRRNTYSFLTIFERVCLYWSECVCSQLDQTHTVHCDVCVVNLAWDHCHVVFICCSLPPVFSLSGSPKTTENIFFHLPVMGSSCAHGYRLTDDDLNMTVSQCSALSSKKQTVQKLGFYSEPMMEKRSKPYALQAF